MIDPSMPTDNINRTSRRVSLLPAVTESQSPSFWATPVRTNPSPITNSTAMSTMLESLKPAIASPTVITPVKGSSTIMINATASMRGLLITNMTTEATSRASTTRSSVFIGGKAGRWTYPQTVRRPGPIPPGTGMVQQCFHARGTPATTVGFINGSVRTVSSVDGSHKEILCPKTKAKHGFFPSISIDG